MGPGRKPRRPVFSQRDPYYMHTQNVKTVPALTSIISKAQRTTTEVPTMLIYMYSHHLKHLTKMGCQQDGLDIEEFWFWFC